MRLLKITILAITNSAIENERTLTCHIDLTNAGMHSLGVFSNECIAPINKQLRL